MQLVELERRMRENLFGIYIVGVGHEDSQVSFSLVARDN